MRTGTQWALYIQSGPDWQALAGRQTRPDQRIGQPARPPLRQRAKTMSSLPTLSATLHVALGGAIGAVLRYMTGRWMTGWLGAPAMGVFPWATLAVNALGSVLMGFLAGWLARNGSAGTENVRLLLGVGLLGGFTTFSAFSLEMVLLIERGQFAIAALYAILSFSLGISGLLFGLTVMRAVS